MVGVVELYGYDGGQGSPSGSYQCGGGGGGVATITGYNSSDNSISGD